MPPLTLSSTLTLPSTHSIPTLGFGAYKGTSHATSLALAAGYRQVDTAQWYGNERELGQAVRDFLADKEQNKAGLERKDVFFTTKYWPSESERETAQTIYDSLDKSVENIDLEGHVDLILLHSPFGGRAAREMRWGVLERLKKEGKAKSIGVSNYGVRHLKEMEEYAKEPVDVNQIELHPWCQQPTITSYCSSHSPPIAIQAYSPLARGEKASDPVIKAIAEEVAKSRGRETGWGEVMIRWGLQKGFIPLPKSNTPSRIISNADIYDFELSEDQMKRLGELDRGEHVTWDPTEAD